MKWTTRSDISGFSLRDRGLASVPPSWAALWNPYRVRQDGATVDPGWAAKSTADPGLYSVRPSRAEEEDVATLEHGGSERIGSRSWRLSQRFGILRTLGRKGAKRGGWSGPVVRVLASAVSDQTLPRKDPLSVLGLQELDQAFIAGIGRGAKCLVPEIR